MSKAILLTFILSQLMFISLANAKEDLSGWTYHEDIDLMTDKNSSTAIIVEEGCTRRCRSVIVRADGSVFINFNKFMNSRDGIKLDYRFDKETMQSTTLNPSTDGTAGFLDFTIKREFVAALMHYKKLTLRGYNYKGTPLTFVVSLKNSSKAIRKLPEFESAPTIDDLKKEKIAQMNFVKETEIRELEYSLKIVEKDLGTESEPYKFLLNQIEEKKKELIK